jgi:hypothetical protein
MWMYIQMMEGYFFISCVLRVAFDAGKKESF